MIAHSRPELQLQTLILFYGRKSEASLSEAIDYFCSKFLPCMMAEEHTFPGGVLLTAKQLGVCFGSYYRIQ